MTGRIEKTVFISYRRTNFWTALAVYKELHSNGFDVFFDYKNIPSGDFEQVITENVKSRAHFIVILSPSALERCQEPGDWLRREIETAIDYKRNIIPLMMEGFDFGSPTTVIALTGKLADLKKYNAMSIPAEYFDDAMVKLRGERFLSRPLESVSHPVSKITKQITEEQKVAANGASPVEREQLTAQEWFERGYSADNAEEVVRFLTETIRLDPNFAPAYTGRGLAYGVLGDDKSALLDFETAISLQRDDAFAFVGRGTFRYVGNDLDGAIEDFNEAIQIDPTYNRAYFHRGKVFEDKDNLDNAISEYQKYLDLGGGAEYDDQKEVEKSINKLKRKLATKKMSKNKRSGL